MSSFDLIQQSKAFQNLPVKHQEIAKKLFALPSSIPGNLIDRGVFWTPTFLKLIQKPYPLPDVQIGAVVGKEIVKTPFNFIPLVIWQSRVLWGPVGTEEAGQALCRSTNGVAPDRENERQIKTCRECPDAKAEKNKCKISINIGGLGSNITGEITPIDIFVIPFSGTSYMTGLSIYKQSKYAVPLYKYSFGIDVQKESSKNLHWYKYVIKHINKTDTSYFSFLEFCQEEVLKYVKELMNRQLSYEEEGGEKENEKEDESGNSKVL